MIEIIDPNRTSAKGLVKWVRECDFDQNGLKIATVDATTGPFDVIIRFELEGEDYTTSHDKIAVFYRKVLFPKYEKQIRVTTSLGVTWK